MARLIDALGDLVPRRESEVPVSSVVDPGMAVSAFVAADIDLDVLVDGELTLRATEATAMKARHNFGAGRAQRA
ncbi:hypothetical protein [Streptomyces sp. NPDC004830]